MAFKSLPAESQRILNDHYEVQIRNGLDESGNVHVRVDSANSEDGWKEMGPGQKVSTTRTVTLPPLNQYLTLVAINRRVSNNANIHRKSAIDPPKTRPQRLDYPGTLSTITTRHPRPARPLRHRCPTTSHCSRNNERRL